MNTKVSVVTVVYNAVKSLEKTILSVLNQSYENIEYIVIDGGSTDGTVDIIKKYADRLAYWVSEPDNGIYNAMNKGIRKATGEWINFMNAGDTFFDRDTVNDVFTGAISPDTAVIYGDSCVKAYGFFFRAQARPLAEIQKTMPFCHQASFSRLAVMQNRLFNLKYKICADYDFFFQQYCRKAKFYYIPQMICTFDAAGLSNRYFEKTQREVCEINGGSLPESRFFYFRTRSFAFRNFHILYFLLKKIQYTCFPGSAGRNGWEKIKMDHQFLDMNL